MKSMSKVFLTLAVAAVLGTGFSARAEAAAISIANVVITPGTVTADIVVSDLNEATGGFAFQVLFNPADFTGGNYAIDPTNKLGDGVSPNLDLSFGFNASGFLDLFVIAGFAPAALTAAQAPFPATFTLAYVEFARSSSTAGTSLELANTPNNRPCLSDALGTGCIPLDGGPNVPEPASMLLLGTGLAMLVARRSGWAKS